MKQLPKFQTTALSAAIATTLFSGSALAQTSDSGPVMREEVLVTATRRAEGVQDIPLNISALGGGTIERDRIENLSDIARRVPGLTVVDQGPRSGNKLTVRGLNVDSISAEDGVNGGGDTVATYYGEIPLYIDLELVDLQRVEVLIGPQGTLYGAGTLGGAVRYIPNKPQSDVTTLDLRGNVYDLAQSESLGYEAGATINIPIVEDKLAFRASVDYMDDPGFIDYNFLVLESGVSNPEPDFSNPADVRANLKSKADANTLETAVAKAAVRYTGDWLDATLSYLYQDQEIGARTINHSDAFGTGKYEAAHRFLEPKDRTNELLSLELIADLGFAEATVAAGYSEDSEEGVRDQTDLLLTFEYGYELFPSFSSFTRDTLDEETLTVEARLVSTSDGPFNWIVGGFYREYEADSLALEFTPGFDQFAVDELGGVGLRPDSLEYYFELQQEIEEFGLFGEIGYQINDRWQVTLGARYFEFEDSVNTGLALPLFDTVFDGQAPDALLIGPESAATEDDDIILKFNTSYDIDDETLVYLTVSEGFRLGGVNAVPPCPEDLNPAEQNVCALPNEVIYSSDTTVNYEIGLRAEPGETGILNAAVYFLEWEDTQIGTITQNGAQPITANVGSAESYGIEVSGQFNITDELQVFGTYAWNRAELTDDVAQALIGDLTSADQADFPEAADVFDGDRLPGSPEHSVYLGARYYIGLKDGSSIDLDWAMTANSDVLTKIGERAFGETLDGFAIHNVSATWSRDNYAVQLYGDNIFDKFAVTGVRQSPRFIQQIDQFTSRRYYHNVIRPREVGIKLTYNFEK